MTGRSDRSVTFLDTEVAEELLELVEDAPGVADEELLDDALEAIESADDHLPADEQHAVAEGEGVAVGLTPEEAEAVATLIAENEEVAPKRLRKVRQALRTKLKQARKKARRSR